MLIRPIDCDLVNSRSHQYEKTYDEYGNEYQDIVRRVSVHPEGKIGRMERISIISDPDEPDYKGIYKESSIGKINTIDNCPVLDFDNYTPESV